MSIQQLAHLARSSDGLSSSAAQQLSAQWLRGSVAQWLRSSCGGVRGVISLFRRVS